MRPAAASSSFSRSQRYAPIDSSPDHRGTREAYLQSPSYASSSIPPPHRRTWEPDPRVSRPEAVAAARFSGLQREGEDLRAGLLELQRPLLGRKYAIKDRRPLDPPPIAKLQLYRTVEDRRGWEQKQLIEDYSEFSELGLICHVDLFPVPKMTDSHCVPQSSDEDSDVVASLDGYLIRESSKCSTALAGETFVQAAKLEYKGSVVLLFIFPDISVRTEGIFILRYRFFDLSLFPGEIPAGGLPILAECYGGTFEIFSTKNFPGLPESTELTKHVAKYNIRVNVRETRRSRIRKQEARPP
ncbi:hypothetical protein GLOTRDRAFT_78159 [Gloeophyllum trabeum ATCC 11539]|uniref:Velvet domain-containing protein n=1 Tax=Gloeophyllum trabeum (strain ATCC 11539 / FP-39264 / Madison 617) TaxID=670483 RepID=S7Q2J6_GLOTA|nr:uncharacterized protein GLOTRDRAFT_78159 [Gloeophyllum trabeum ATCC 11539]EPQ54221.1 hypothetical protein GLOTRDRAFT_78159 [Gloeophyllum trabeum ATCC 11539]